MTSPQPAVGWSSTRWETTPSAAATSGCRRRPMMSLPMCPRAAVTAPARAPVVVVGDRSSDREGDQTDRPVLGGHGWQVRERRRRARCAPGGGDRRARRGRVVELESAAVVVVAEGSGRRPRSWSAERPWWSVDHRLWWSERCCRPRRGVSSCCRQECTDRARSSPGRSSWWSSWWCWCWSSRTIGRLAHHRGVGRTALRTVPVSWSETPAAWLATPPPIRARTATPASHERSPRRAARARVRADP